MLNVKKRLSIYDDAGFKEYKGLKITVSYI